MCVKDTLQSIYNTLISEVFLDFFLRVSLSPLRGSLSLSQRNISRKTSGTKIYLKGCINDLLQNDGYLI